LPRRWHPGSPLPYVPRRLWGVLGSYQERCLDKQEFPRLSYLLGDRSHKARANGTYGARKK